MDAFHRQRDILTLADLAGLDVEIVGAGSLGGAILLCLGKMGFGFHNRITVTDFDRCEMHNLATQWFRPSHVALEERKVDALAELMAWVCDLEIRTVPDRFTGDEARRLGPVVVQSVDTLEERRRIWQRLRSREDVRFLVDARMGAEVLEILCVDLETDSREGYERSLDDEGEPYVEPCTGQAILYTALGAAGFVGSLLRAYARGEDFPRRIVFDFRHYLVSTESAELLSAQAG